MEKIYLVVKPASLAGEFRTEKFDLALQCFVLDAKLLRAVMDRVLRRTCWPFFEGWLELGLCFQIQSRRQVRDSCVRGSG